MVNGLSIKQAIENELEGKDEYTINDTVKCIKHIADGIDNQNVTELEKKVEKISSRMKWHEKIFGAVYSVTIGVITYFFKKQ